MTGTVNRANVVFSYHIIYNTMRDIVFIIVPIYSTIETSISLRRKKIHFHSKIHQQEMRLCFSINE